MELEKLKGFIENAKALQGNRACTELAVHFESLAELYQLQKEGLFHPEHIERLHQSYDLFWRSFDEVVQGFGLDPESLKANLNNEAFFHPEQWKAMQAFKQEILGETGKGSKRLDRKRDLKKVRI